MDVFISKKMRNFIVLAQTKSIAKSAEKLHMTPSPLGKSIAALEEQVGYELFNRKDKKLTLNKAGEELYQSLFPIYQRLSAVDSEFSLNHNKKVKKLVVGIDDTYPTIIFDQLISLCDKYDGLVTQPFEYSEDNVIDNLLGGYMDFIISPQPGSQRLSHLSNIKKTALKPLRLGFLVSRQHEDKSAEELLTSLPWLQMRFQNRANFESLLEAYLQELNIEPKIIYRPYSFLAKISAVEKRNFITIIPYCFYALVNPNIFRYLDSPKKPIQLQEYLYCLHNNQHIEIIVEHIQQDREPESKK